MEEFIETKEWFGGTTAGLLLSVTVTDIGRPELLKRLAAIYNKFCFEANNITSSTARVIRFRSNNLPCAKDDYKLRFINGLDKTLALGLLTHTLHKTIERIHDLNLIYKMLSKEEHRDVRATISACLLEQEIKNWLKSAVHAKFRECYKVVDKHGWLYSVGKPPPESIFEYQKWENGK